MDRHYDLFEILPDGSPVWKCAIDGLENAMKELRVLATGTANEVRIMHLTSNAVIATLNVSQPPTK